MLNVNIDIIGIISLKHVNFCKTIKNVFACVVFNYIFKYHVKFQHYNYIHLVLQMKKSACELQFKKNSI